MHLSGPTQALLRRGEFFLQWGMTHMMGIYPLKEQTTERTSLTLSFIRLITNADMYCKAGS